MNINPRVVDLSHYDNVTDWDRVKAFGIRGVINKATEGPAMVDRTFAIRKETTRKVGLLYGAYHFLRPGNIDLQAAHFIDAVGDPNGILLALDHEDPDVPLNQAKEWLQIVHDKTGLWPVLYSGFLIKQQLGFAKDPLLAQCRLWLAQYTTAPVWPPNWETPWLWQYTGDGRGPLPHHVPGITLFGGAGIDINSFQGSDDQLAEEWAGQSTTPVA